MTDGKISLSADFINHKFVPGHKFTDRERGMVNYMKILDAKFVQGFIRMCNDGWEQGWHERNGGNLSYRVKPEEVEEIKDSLAVDGEWKPIGSSITFRKYFPLPVTIKYSPARSGTDVPIGFHSLFPLTSSCVF